MTPRVRIPPSPTGNLHLGNAYTFLFNYLFAKKNKGVLILRFEDTDKERSKKEFEDNILESLKWLGIKWDEGPIHQSDRLDSYKKACEKLIKEDKAYYCFCTKEELDKERKDQSEKKLPQVYSGKCRSLSKEKVGDNLKENKDYVVRFKMPPERGKIKFKDLILGEIEFDALLIGDSVIMRSSGVPLYNFAVVIDDIDMNITHVLRGEDHISNTPKQVVLFEAMRADLPEFAHWPNILNPDRIGKLSKRENATSVLDYKKDGYLSEAIINYLAILGWTPPEEKEIISISEMEESFELTKMRKSPAAFDIVKLDWVNGEYIRGLTDEELTLRLEEYLVDHPNKDRIRELAPLIKERIKKLSDFIPLTNFFFSKPEYDLGAFKLSNLPESVEEVKEVLRKITAKFENLPRPIETVTFEEAFRKLADEFILPAGDIFQLIRIAISGQRVTPPLFESIKILGEEETLNRLKSVADNYPNFTDLTADLKVETQNI